VVSDLNIDKSGLCSPVRAVTALGDALVVSVRVGGRAGLDVRLVVDGEPKPTTRIVFTLDGTGSWSTIFVPAEAGEHVVELEVLAGALDTSRLDVVRVRA
jgi:hypothetical protein